MIHYITKKPTDHTEGYVRFSAGSFNDLNVEAAFGSPLASGVEARLSVVHHQHDGTERNLNPLGKNGNAPDLTAERAQLAFDFTNAVSVLLTVEHGENNNDGGNTYRYAASYLLPDSLAALEPGNSMRNAAVVGSSNNIADASGAVSDRAMVLAPNLSLNALARYSWEAWAGSRISLQLDASSRSSVYFDNLNSPALRESGYALADLRLGWASGEQHLQVAGLVENLTDKRYRLYAFDLTSLLGYVQDLYNKPRTFVVSLLYRF